MANITQEGNTLKAQLSSSAISAATFNTDTKAMTITFTSGKTYDFPSADQGIFEGLVHAPSPGSFYAKQIKGRF